MQTINTLILVIGVFAGVFSGIHLANIQKQKMPEHIAVRLEQFSHMAAWQVEQQNKTLGRDAKKQLAISATVNLFHSFKLPVPPNNAINTAIESAVFLLPKDNSPTS